MTGPVASAVATVREFFEHNEFASLKLPDRWFGRPYDNFHQLSSVGFTGEEIRVILDGQQVLSFAVTSVEVRGRELHLGTAGGSWHWQSYGGTDIHKEVVPAGTIEFHAPRL